jgi:mannitol/fructose-specific phosphotransferase system IIA component (Ntr-type)
MKITEVLHKEAILVDLKANDKKGVLEELSEPISQIAGINQQELVRVLMEREQLGSTGIGGGIGIPHGKLKNLDNWFLVLGSVAKESILIPWINVLRISFSCLLHLKIQLGFTLKYWPEFQGF